MKISFHSIPLEYKWKTEHTPSTEPVLMIQYLGRTSAGHLLFVFSSTFRMAEDLNQTAIQHQTIF